MEGAAGRSLILSLGLLLAPLAGAQTAAPEAAPVPPAPPDVIIKASSEGFSLSSPDKAFVLKLRGYIQTDTRLFASDVARPVTSTFLVRRARPLVEGTLYGAFDYRLLLDFAAGAPTLWDAYVEYRPRKEVRLRVGRARPAVGLERLQSATATSVLERSLPTQLVPNRDVGFQLSGEVAGVLTYALGAYNGTPDGANSDLNLDDSFDLAARIFVQPFRTHGPRPLSGLGVGVAATNGQAFGSATSTGLSVLRTPGQQIFFSYRTGTGLAETAVADGNHFRFTPQGYFYAGPVGVLAEYATSAQEVSRGEDHARLRHTSWQATASVVLFGGDASYEGVRPRNPFKPSGEGWGAVEVAGRYTELHVDPDAFPIYADPARSAHDAKDWGVGANWYLSSNLRVGASFDHTTFEGGAEDGDRTAESLFLSRFQVSW